MAEANRIDTALEACKAAGRVAFVPYVTGGYPTDADTVPMLLAMQEAGADVIEMGVPFSDPLADGPTIQAANQVALRNGVTLSRCLEYIREARDAGLTVPVVLMGYYNPMYKYGNAKLAADAKAAGVDAFIVVDLPPEEAADLLAACDTHSLYFIPLVAPTTTDDRLRYIATIAKGYLYCVSITGITGNRDGLPEHLPGFLERVRRFVSTPLAVGFGLSTPSHVTQVGKLAEAAVMGSSIVKAAAKGDTPEQRAASVKRFVQWATGRVDTLEA